MTKLLHKADLHIHTTWSDGTATVPALLDYVATHTDLAVIAITDHDSIAGAQLAHRLGGQYGIEVVIGEEVSTADGHLLALFIDRLIPPGRSAAETIAAVHSQGGLCFAAHPFDHGVPSLGRAGLRQRCIGPRAGEWALDGIEGFNASVMWPRRACNKAAQHFGQERNLVMVGGSDAHSLATVGRGYTLFSGATANDLYHALQHNLVQCAGEPWNARHYLEIMWLYQRQRTLRGALNLLASDGAVPLKH